jgi:hypothetical protein
MQHLFVCPHSHTPTHTHTHTIIDQRFQEHTGVPRIVIVRHICTPVCKKRAAQRCHSHTALHQSNFFAQWVRFAHTHGLSRTGYPSTQQAGCFPHVIQMSDSGVCCAQIHLRIWVLGLERVTGSRKLMCQEAPIERKTSTNYAHSYPLPYEHSIHSLLHTHTRITNTYSYALTCALSIHTHSFIPTRTPHTYSYLSTRALHTLIHIICMLLYYTHALHMLI